MQIGIPRETRAGETRVAATAETVKKIASSGKHAIVVEAGAGLASSVTDADYTAAGATIASAAEALGSDLVLKVRVPRDEELRRLKRGASIIGLLEPFDAAALQALAATGVTGFALEWLPRITRAQSMDVLSSQANIAGYKAVVMAADEYGKFMARAAVAKAQLMKRVPDFTISRLEAKQFSNHPVWIEEIRTHFIAGLRKAGVPE